MTQGPAHRASRIRVSRQEREATVDVLQEHYAAERLQDEEFTNRVHQALTASTRADLTKLVEDLPVGQRRREEPSRRVRPAAAVTLVVGAAVAAAGLLGGAFASPAVEAQNMRLSTGQMTGPDAGCPDATTEQLQIFSDVTRADRAAEQLQDLTEHHPGVHLQGLAARAKVSAERADNASLDSRQIVMADEQPSKNAMVDLAKTSGKAADDAQGAVDEALHRIDRE